MRGAWALLALLLFARPVGAEAAWLARPEAVITLKVEAIEVGALLTFLAAAGGTSLTMGPGVTGMVRRVDFEGVGVEQAFRAIVQGQGLELSREGARLRVMRPDPSPLPVPMPPRPELVVPPGQ